MKRLATVDGMELMLCRPGELTALEIAAKVFADALAGLAGEATDVAPQAPAAVGRKKKARRGKAGRVARGVKVEPPPRPGLGPRNCVVCKTPFTPWRRDQKICSGCRGKNAPKATAPARSEPAAGSPAGVRGPARIKALLARVDKMSPAERNAAAASAEAREAGGS
jgi:hypothetical protein